MKKFYHDLCWLYAYFIIFSCMGWIWEVIYKYFRWHVFIKRGMNHLPWLPIYGWGSIIVLFMYLLMKKKNIIKVFLTSAVICTTFEYFSSWLLEKAFGLRWWNYRNYFLNINGRICLQSFLLFGIIGVLGIYILVPKVYNFINRIESKRFYQIMPIIILIFMTDITISFIKPNQGEHITYSNRTEKDVEVRNIECTEIKFENIKKIYCK